MWVADKNILLPNLHLQLQFQKSVSWKPKSYIDFLFHSYKLGNFCIFLSMGEVNILTLRHPFLLLTKEKTTLILN